MPRLTTLRPRLATLDARTARPPPKQAEAELLTPEHRAWRLEVLKRAHWRCQWEGCGKRGGRGGVRLIAHHIRERRDGGDPLDPANGMALCDGHHATITARNRAQRMAETP